MELRPPPPPQLVRTASDILQPSQPNPTQTRIGCLVSKQFNKVCKQTSQRGNARAPPPSLGCAPSLTLVLVLVLVLVLANETSTTTSQPMA